MSELLSRMNDRIRPLTLLSGYWAFFWLLNGLDKFVNGTMQPMIADGLAKGVLVDADGEIGSTLYGLEVSGLFGVNRNAKTVAFFDRLGVPEPFSLGLLYSVAVLEIALAALFVLGLVSSLRGRTAHRTYTALAYKISMLIFMAFCVVDILIGERIELWEHNTFLLVLMVSYLWFINSDIIPPRKLKSGSFAA